MQCNITAMGHQDENYVVDFLISIDAGEFLILFRLKTNLKFSVSERQLIFRGRPVRTKISHTANVKLHIREIQRKFKSFSPMFS